MRTLQRRRFFSLIFYFGSSFVLHLIWENLQGPLYVGFISFSAHFKACLFGTATGDMVFMLVIYATLAITHRNLWWITERSIYAQPATWILPVIVGILLATSYELWAVYTVHRWEYGSMPLVPILRVGLSPFLQMIVVPLLTILVTSRSRFVS